MEGYGREKLYRVFKIAGLLVAMFVALAFLAKFTGSDGIKKIYETFQELITSGSVDDAGRTQLHEQAIRYFIANPILGIGWTNFMKMFTLRNTHVHCIYLQLLCETGLVGFIAFVGFFFCKTICCNTETSANGQPNRKCHGRIVDTIFIVCTGLLFNVWHYRKSIV